MQGFFIFLFFVKQREQNNLLAYKDKRWPSIPLMERGHFHRTSVFPHPIFIWCQSKHTIGHNLVFKKAIWGLPWWRSGWESACQCRGHGFEPWSERIPHAAEQLNPWATATEPARLEPVLRNCKRPRQWEARAPRWKVAPARCNWRKALAQKRRPNAAKNKFKNK